jgi:hypothetical protein
MPAPQPREHDVDRVADRVHVGEVVVGDRQADGALAQLGLDRLHEIDQREVVGVEVLAQARVAGDRVGIGTEDLDELVAHDALDLGGGDRAPVAVGLSRHR